MRENNEVTAEGLRQHVLEQLAKERRVAGFVESKDWHAIGFGRHQKLTAPQILFKDPEWAFWAYDQMRTRSTSSCDHPELKLASERAMVIRIPETYRGDACAEYTFNVRSGSLERLAITQRSLVEPGDTVHVRDVIDMSMPRRFAGRSYDKGGYKRFLRDMKRIVLGWEGARVSKREANQFFSDQANFAPGTK